MATKREKHEKSFFLTSTDSIHPFCLILTSIVIYIEMDIIIEIVIIDFKTF